MNTKVSFIPSMFTIFNLIFGVSSIAATASGSILWGAWLIIFAIFCDGMDGKIARWTNSTSAFGNELDSLADLVSSGIAPGLIIFMLLHSFGFVVPFILMAVFVLAGAYRLARFNVMQKGDRSRGYIGLPIPVAGFTVASFVLFLYQDFLILAKTEWLFILIPLLSVIMVSTVKYNWPRLDFRESWMKSVLSVIKIILLILMTLFPHFVLFPLFCGYVLNGLAVWLLQLKFSNISLEFIFWPKMK